MTAPVLHVLAWAWLAGVVGWVALWVWRHPEEWGTIGKLFGAWVWISLTASAFMFLAYSCTTPAHARPVFVRKADGRTTIMVTKEVVPADPAKVSGGNVARGASQEVAASPVTLTYTIPQWQRATVGCDAPAMNTIAAHVDSVRLLAWLPMPDDSRVWNLAAWVAAQQAGRPSPIVVRTKWIGGRTGVDTIGVPAGLPVGTTGAVVSFAGDSVSCVSNLARLVNP